MPYKVRAKDDGFHGGVHRPKDGVFDLDRSEDFAPSWQIPIGWTPNAPADPDPAIRKKG